MSEIKDQRWLLSQTEYSQKRWLLLQKGNSQKIYKTTFNFWWIFVAFIPLVALFDMILLRLYWRAAFIFIAPAFCGAVFNQAALSSILLLPLILWHWLSRKSDGLNSLLNSGWFIRSSSNSKSSGTVIKEWLSAGDLDQKQFWMLLKRHGLDKQFNSETDDEPSDARLAEREKN